MHEDEPDAICYSTFWSNHLMPCWCCATHISNPLSMTVSQSQSNRDLSLGKSNINKHRAKKITKKEIKKKLKQHQATFFFHPVEIPFLKFSLISHCHRSTWDAMHVQHAGEDPHDNVIFGRLYYCTGPRSSALLEPDLR